MYTSSHPAKDPRRTPPDAGGSNNGREYWRIQLSSKGYEVHDVFQLPGERSRRVGLQTTAAIKTVPGRGQGVRAFPTTVVTAPEKTPADATTYPATTGSANPRSHRPYRCSDC